MINIIWNVHTYKIPVLGWREVLFLLGQVLVKVFCGMQLAEVWISFPDNLLFLMRSVLLQEDRFLHFGFVSSWIIPVHVDLEEMLSFSVFCYLDVNSCRYFLLCYSWSSEKTDELCVCEMLCHCCICWVCNNYLICIFYHPFKFDNFVLCTCGLWQTWNKICASCVCVQVQSFKWNMCWVSVS
jgi:hypothetical protein